MLIINESEKSKDSFFNEIQELVQNLIFAINLEGIDIDEVTNQLIDLSNKIYIYKNTNVEKLIEMPCKIGETVWVSPNFGKSFHTGIFLGIMSIEDNINLKTYIVKVNDKERKFVDNPLDKEFIDYFSKIYTQSEIETINK